MSRRIDRLPTPTHVEPKKLIVLSAPRTGTHGLYLALKRLGFKPFHMAEIIKAGPEQVELLNDGLYAEMFHEGKPYGRAEFDKWFADYDIIIEMPFFMLRSTLEAYPDAKFLLTERNPDKWAKSFENTVGMMAEKLTSFPMSVFKYFDAFAYHMARMGTVVLNYYTNGCGLTPEGHKNLMNNYSNYIAEVKRLVPPEQLKVCKLEDGFGWDEICPYLGVPVPDEKWPSLNTPEEFGEIANPKVKNAFMKGMFGTTSIIAPIVAAGVWFLKSRKLSL
ncbi:P-loop containing nucleoside triphosphate hydrolase protein [Daldinia caldariorum]|uniref:P-loop containing nucleoside triphosphate hydrolase protein n=1 Tax=Daldinia caldariorum TaxID=326644 RepID=UPI002007CB60|nr:P-loop containing nucleoside triphosphate hydrolase protein [Daldinia caldariorum]KAI1470287.1 P-loop containing nucleoside triphosphate hydrolase protein [Daldinia caldariorum]